jgi:hypothetical protein
MMMLPVVLYALATWMDRGVSSAWHCLVGACALLVVLHPVGGLLGYPLAALGLACYALMAGAYQRAAAGLAALALGAGLAAFYWLPVAREWDLVEGWRLTAGLFEYTQYFVHPLELLGLRPPQRAVRLAFGPVLLVLLALNALFFTFSPDSTGAQRRLVLVLVLALALSVLLMSAASGWLWARIRLLQMVQFPWRLMMVAAIASAGLAGATVFDRGRTGIAIVAVIGLVAIAAQNRSPLRFTFDYPRSADEIANVFFAPDGAHEWLPRQATLLAGDSVPREPVCSPGCRVEEFHRTQGWLRCRVTTTTATRLILPQYFFPVGWQATANGMPLALERDPRGLMLVRLAPQTDTLVEVRFGMTPMRAAGLRLSALAVSLWVAIAVWFRQMHGNSATGCER